MHRAMVAAAALLLAASGLGAAARPEVPADLGTVVFASVLFRHGDRAPLCSYPSDPYSDTTRYWPRGLGQLTEVGEEQMYELGRFLRERYGHMLPLTYHVNHTYVRSTCVDRTLQSAQCTLAGLYPGSSVPSAPHMTFQPVPVHSAEEGQDTLLAGHEACPQFLQLVRLASRAPELSCVRRLTAELRQHAARFAGVARLTPLLCDTLHVQELHNLSLPAWTRGRYPHPLSSLCQLEALVATTATTRLRRLLAGELLGRMAADMRAKMAATLRPDRRLHLYSAHDLNLAALLRALGVFDGVPAPYASAVLVELRLRDARHYVTVWYRNSTQTAPHLLTLPGCEALCPAVRFTELVQPLVPADWQAECTDELPTEKAHEKLRVPPSAVLPEWAHCFAQPDPPMRDCAPGTS